jgi:hypothetical protein
MRHLVAHLGRCFNLSDVPILRYGVYPDRVGWLSGGKKVPEMT